MWSRLSELPYHNRGHASSHTGWALSSANSSNQTESWLILVTAPHGLEFSVCSVLKVKMENTFPCYILPHDESCEREVYDNMCINADITSYRSSKHVCPVSHYASGY